MDGIAHFTPVSARIALERSLAGPAGVDGDRDHQVVPRRRSTGVPALDLVTAGGVADAELVVIAADRGVPASQLALQWARHVAQSGAVAVYITSGRPYEELVVELVKSELVHVLVDADGTSMARPDPDELQELRGRVEDVVDGVLDLTEVLASHPALVRAEQALVDYAERLLLVTDDSGGVLDAARVAMAAASVSEPPATVIVDLVGRGAAYDLDPAGLREVARSGRTVTVVAPLDSGGLVRVDGDGVRRLAGSADLVVELHRVVDGVDVTAWSPTGRRVGRAVLIAFQGSHDEGLWNSSWLT